MTTLPTASGSYVRHPDGSLELIQDTQPPEAPAPAAPAEPAPVETARKGALKAPLKE